MGLLRPVESSRAWRPRQHIHCARINKVHRKRTKQAKSIFAATQRSLLQPLSVVFSAGLPRASGCQAHGARGLQVLGRNCHRTSAKTGLRTKAAGGSPVTGVPLADTLVARRVCDNSCARYRTQSTDPAGERAGDGPLEHRERRRRPALRPSVTLSPQSGTAMASWAGTAPPSPRTPHERRFIKNKHLLLTRRGLELPTRTRSFATSSDLLRSEPRQVSGAVGGRSVSRG